MLHICCRFVACVLQCIPLLPECCLHVLHVYIFFILYMIFVIYKIFRINLMYKDCMIIRIFLLLAAFLKHKCIEKSALFNYLMEILTVHCNWTEL